LCWLQRVAAGEGALICLEETGCYGRALAAFLHEAGHHASLVNAALIKNFGRSLNMRTKNDRIDAWLIARYAWDRRPQPWIPLAPCHQQLREAARRRAQLMEMLVQEKNHLEASPCAEIRADICALKEALEQRIAAMTAHMRTLARSDAGLSRNLQLLISIPGIGELSGLLLLAELPAVDSFKSARQLSAFAGLTPRESQSGSSLQGKARLCKQGRGVLRKILFMPAVSLLHSKSGSLRRFADRLLAAAKPKMCVLGALMRKLICLAFAILRSSRPFDPNYAGPLSAH
jgi:transposase